MPIMQFLWLSMTLRECDGSQVLFHNFTVIGTESALDKIYFMNF